MAAYAIGVRKVEPLIGSVVVEADNAEQAIRLAWDAIRNGEATFREELIAPKYSITDVQPIVARNVPWRLVDPDQRVTLEASFAEARPRVESDR